MNFDTNAKTTDIIMFNSRNLGALIVNERPHVQEWMSPSSVSRTSVSRKATVSACSTKVRQSQSPRTVRVRANEFNPVAHAVVSVGSDKAVFELPADLVGAGPIGVSAERFGFF